MSRKPPSISYRLTKALRPEFERAAKRAGIRPQDRLEALNWALEEQEAGRYWLSTHQAAAAWVVKAMAEESV